MAGVQETRQTQRDGGGSRALVFAGEGLAELAFDGAQSTFGCGGDAANAAAMCARLGGPSRLLGRVGADPLGRRLLGFWRACGVDVSMVRTDRAAPTGIYINELGLDGAGAEPTFTYWRTGSAGSRWGPDDLADVDWNATAAIVVTGLTATVSVSCAAAVWRLIEGARARSVPVACILNYRPALEPDPFELTRLASAADVLIASTHDLAATFGTCLGPSGPGPLPGPSPELVMTAGARGATVFWEGGTIHQPAPAVEVVDAVGAGDAFAGAYLWARFHQRAQPDTALTWAVAVASFSVQHRRCACGYPSAAQAAMARSTLPPAVRGARPRAAGRLIASRC